MRRLGSVGGMPKSPVERCEAASTHLEVLEQASIGTLADELSQAAGAAARAPRLVVVRTKPTSYSIKITYGLTHSVEDPF
jgi:hypothetical protein